MASQDSFYTDSSGQSTVEAYESQDLFPASQVSSHGSTAVTPGVGTQLDTLSSSTPTPHRYHTRNSQTNSEFQALYRADALVHPGKVINLTAKEKADYSR